MAAIFEPFLQTLRQRQSGGVGLGLALAHELTRLLGEQLSAANQAEGGQCFCWCRREHIVDKGRQRQARTPAVREAGVRV